jgi:hypothetical protein
LLEVDHGCLLYDYFESIHNHRIKMIRSRRMSWVQNVARKVKKRNAYRILVRKPEVKRSLGRPRRRWVDNIKMDHREIGWHGMDWIDLAVDRD